MQQLFIGLSDILLSDPDNSEIKDTRKRDQMQLQQVQRMKRDRKIQNAHVNVRWLSRRCKHESINCFTNLFEYGKVLRDNNHAPDAVFINVMVHVVRKSNRSLNNLFADVEAILQEGSIPNLTWVTGT
jgi:hypothetical protein